MFEDRCIQVHVSVFSLYYTKCLDKWIFQKKSASKPQKFWMVTHASGSVLNAHVQCFCIWISSTFHVVCIALWDCFFLDCSSNDQVIKPATGITWQLLFSIAIFKFCVCSQYLNVWILFKHSVFNLKRLI